MGYSYWVDELYTIQFISGTWTELISKYILPDTHPPLYFITAKAWTSLFGTHEASTRTLSSIFSLALIITLWNEWRAKASPRRLILLLLIIINPYFLYYSQETRGYSLLLFLASLATLQSINQLGSNTLSIKANNSKTTHLAIIALSLVHYFGFIFSASILLIRSIAHKEWGLRLKELQTLVIISIWPVIHLGIYGGTGHSQISRIALAGQSWWQLLQIYSITNLPFINSGVTFLDIITLLLITFIFAIGIKTLNTKANLESNYNQSLNEIFFCITIIGVLIIFIGIINIKSPISTYRNYMIFIPPSAVILANSFEAAFKFAALTKPINIIIKLLSLSVIAITTIISIKISHLNLDQKIFFGPDYKDLASYITDNQICITRCYQASYDPSDISGKELFGHYFGKFNLTSLSSFDLNNSSQLNFPIIGMHSSVEKIDDLAEKYQYTNIFILNSTKPSSGGYSFVLTK